MKVARAVFIGSYRVSHACLSMKFDHHLKNIDQTYIFTSLDGAFLDNILSKYVDTTGFIYVNDEEMNSRFPSIKNWWFDGDYRGSWLYQQALKMASVEYVDADVTLIQDPDTFSIVPYTCVNEKNEPKFFILPNETHSYGYYKVLENSLGIKRQTPHCFVTEFMPTFKEDWLKLKHTLEIRNNCDAFDAIINNVPDEHGLKWFSEYEYLGNWTMTQRSVELIEQKRFQYKTLAELDNLTLEYNCACDAIPKLDDSILMDWETNTVKDFDTIFDKVKKFL